MSELKPRITENGIDYILVGDYWLSWGIFLFTEKISYVIMSIRRFLCQSALLGEMVRKRNRNSIRKGWN